MNIITQKRSANSFPDISNINISILNLNSVKFSLSGGIQVFNNRKAISVSRIVEYLGQGSFSWKLPLMYDVTFGVKPKGTPSTGVNIADKVEWAVFKALYPNYCVARMVSRKVKACGIVGNVGLILWV